MSRGAAAYHKWKRPARRVRPMKPLINYTCASRHFFADLPPPPVLPERLPPFFDAPPLPPESLSVFDDCFAGLLVDAVDVVAPSLLDFVSLLASFVEAVVVEPDSPLSLLLATFFFCHPT